jgi:hypothetical protein
MPPVAPDYGGGYMLPPGGMMGGGGMDPYMMTAGMGGMGYPMMPYGYPPNGAPGMMQPHNPYMMAGGGYPPHGAGPGPGPAQQPHRLSGPPRGYSPAGYASDPDDGYYQQQHRQPPQQQQQQQRVGAAGMDIGGDARGQGRAEKLSYAEELRRQMAEKDSKKKHDKRTREREEIEAEKQQAWDPFGKGGAGAPLKDASGNLVADYRALKHGDASPEPRGRPDHGQGNGPPLIQIQAEAHAPPQQWGPPNPAYASGGGHPSAVSPSGRTAATDEHGRPVNVYDLTTGTQVGGGGFLVWGV